MSVTRISAAAVLVLLGGVLVAQTINSKTSTTTSTVSTAPGAPANDTYTSITEQRLKTIMYDAETTEGADFRYDDPACVP